jgi:hypothetical protein
MNDAPPYPSLKKPDRRWINHVLLAIICLCGFIIRYRGINHDIPYSGSREEAVIVKNALNILKTGSFHPGPTGYPGLNVYLNAFVYILNYFYAISEGLLTSMADVSVEDAFSYISHPSFLLAGRLLSVLSGSLCILFTFKLGEKFHSQRAGVMAALFLAFSFSHVEQSRFIQPDVLAGLMAAITLLECFYIMELGNRKFYLMAGFFAGLSIASKYSVFFIVLPPILAHLLSDRKSHFFNTDFFLMVMFVGMGYTMAAPYTFLDLPGFLHWAGEALFYYKRSGYESAAGGIRGRSQALYYLKYFYSSGMGGLVLLICALAGVGLGFIHHRKKQVMFISFPAAYFIFMCMQKVNLAKDMISTLPFMAVMGALSAVMLMELFIWYFPQVIRIRPLILAGAAMGLIYPSAVKCVEHTRKMLDHRESRTVAVEWLKENISAEDSVAIIKETRIFRRETEDSPFSVDWFGQTEHRYSWYKEKGYRYIVTSDRYGFRHSAQVTEEKQADTYNTFFSVLPLIKQFGENELQLDSYSENPVITVLEVAPPEFEEELPPPEAETP